MSLEQCVIVRGLHQSACFVFVSASLAACATGHPSPGTAPTMPLDTPFILRIGEKAALAEAGTLEVLGVRDDSRCPQDVNCIWAGDASVDLRLTPVHGNPAERVLSLRAPSLELETSRGVRLTLVELRPATRSGSRIAPADYRATLTLTRKRDD